MADINVRVGEGCAPDPNLLWDTVWDPAAGVGDWAVAGPVETLNSGGLQATAALDTAVVLCLFTDLRCPPNHPLAKYVEDGDPRGWWGDGVDVRADLGERPLGSLWWLLERSAIDPVETPRWLVSLARDALAVLVDQGAAARVDAQAVVDKVRNRADVAIQLYGRDGTRIYDRRFENVWAQVGRA